MLLASRGAAPGESIFDEGEENGVKEGVVGGQREEAGPDGLYPYAHRDIKRESFPPLLDFILCSRSYLFLTFSTIRSRVSPLSFTLDASTSPLSLLPKLTSFPSSLFLHFPSFSNIMIADDGKTPILMDLGSCLPARIHIRTRQEALTQQDIAAEHSSMPYRAPELFDVHTGQTLDEKVDIWVSLVLSSSFSLSSSFASFSKPSPFPVPAFFLPAPS